MISKIITSRNFLRLPVRFLHSHFHFSRRSIKKISQNSMLSIRTRKMSKNASKIIPDSIQKLSILRLILPDLFQRRKSKKRIHMNTFFPLLDFLHQSVLILLSMHFSRCQRNTWFSVMGKMIR